jgi:hypothetical protein
MIFRAMEKGAITTAFENRGRKNAITWYIQNHLGIQHGKVSPYC